MIWEPPLSWCTVDCDGSACGSGKHDPHVHQPQFHPWCASVPAARAVVRRGAVIRYLPAEESAQ
jgi:hypothetical protein